MDTRAFFRSTSADHWPAPLVDWLAQAEPAALFRINVRQLASQLRLPLSAALPPFLHGTADGVFRLSWEYHCPHCHAIPGFLHNFSGMHGSDDCPLCNVTFRNSLDTNVEVTFTIHESVQRLPADLEQSWKTRMYAGAREHTWEMPAAFLSGMDCLTSPVFRELFGEDVLSAEESLDIGRMTLLFTDIKGSTKMYSEFGDARSYNIVRDHFKVLFASIGKNDGLVVKTIGDAVMAVFVDTARAMQAALEAWEAFKTRTWQDIGSLEIKMGLHAGGAIAVNLDDRMDYFGNTVNTAARIQALAENHSICFSQVILDDAGTRSLLSSSQKRQGLHIVKRHADLKGIGDTVYYSLS